jgi:hypothetical protein
MSLCNSCQYLFSWRPVEPRQKYHVGSVPNITEQLAATDSTEACPFCSFLRLSLPNEEAKYVEGKSVAKKQGWNVDHGYDVYLENRPITIFGKFNHYQFPALVRKAGLPDGPRLELVFTPKSRVSLRRRLRLYC